MRIGLYTLAAVVFLSSCKKPQPATNLNSNFIAVVGHAGNGIPGMNNDLPANSWEAVLHALEINNADGVELDMSLSADSVLFMYHDRELDALSTCSGCPYNYSSVELAKCTFKPVVTALAKEHYLTPVEEVLKRCQTYLKKPVIFFDLHVGIGCAASAEKEQWYYSSTLYAINALLSKYNAYDYVFVQANSFEWLLEARQNYPQIKVFLDLDINTDNITQAAANGFYGIASKNKEITKDDVTFAHSKGLHVQIWGAGGNDMVDAINKSPDYMLTDNIPLLQSMLNY